MALINSRPTFYWTTADITLRIVADRSAATPVPERSDATPESAPEPPAAVPTLRVFVSSSHSNQASVEEFCDHLCARGIRIWGDPDSLMPGQSLTLAIQRALDEVDAAVLFMTPKSLQSSAFLSTELPEIIARSRREPGFRVFPVLDGVSVAELNEAMQATSYGLSDFSMGVFSLDADPAARSMKLVVVAYRILERVLLAHLRRLPPGQAIEIDVFSRAGSNHDNPATVQLDWVKLFKTNPPSPETCRMLLGALNDLHEVLRQGGSRPIALRPAEAHLSAGLAFGYVFRETTGFSLQIEQQFPPRTGQAPQWWRSDQAAPKSPLILAASEEIEPDKGDITVEISIGKSVDEHVNNWIAEQNPSLCTRLKLAPENGPQPDLLLDGAQALAIARQVSEAIARYRRPRGRTHIFGAIPIGLAVLIGAQLNASGSIQSYELVNDEYRPSFLLGEER